MSAPPSADGHVKITVWGIKRAELAEAEYNQPGGHGVIMVDVETHDAGKATLVFQGRVEGLLQVCKAFQEAGAFLERNHQKYLAVDGRKEPRLEGL